MTITNPVRPAQAGAGTRRATPALRTGLVRLHARADGTERRDLTDREVEVLALIAAGGTRDEIARHLGMASGTVASHMSRIYRALGARNAAHAVALAHGSGVISAPAQPPAPFVSRRERQVLAGMADGLTTAQVANCLSLSTETVKAHLQRVYRKLHASCRANAVDTAIRRRLLAVVVETRSSAAFIPSAPGSPAIAQSALQLADASRSRVEREASGDAVSSSN
jgi:DNA-binding NarL/FixJ family response regulator